MPFEKVIYCCIHDSPTIRRKMIAVQATRMGLAAVPSDALKIVRHELYDADLQSDYILLFDTVNLASASWIVQTLYRRALMGAPVVIGTKRIPKGMEFMCRPLYPEDLRRK